MNNNWKEKALNIIASYSDGCSICVHSNPMKSGYFDCTYMNDKYKNKSMFEISKEKFEKEYNIKL